jgi:hypothetical protein
MYVRGARVSAGLNLAESQLFEIGYRSPGRRIPLSTRDGEGPWGCTFAAAVTACQAAGLLARVKADRLEAVHHIQCC